MRIKINEERCLNYLDEIKLLIPGAGNEAGYTRLAFSDDEKAAHEWLINKLLQIGCTVRQDSVGNIIGRYGAYQKPVIAIGSHLDTVPEGGLFDGTLGIIGGLEVLSIIIEQELFPEETVELICFTGEETNPLGGTFGSRAMAGQIMEEDPLVNSAANRWFTFEEIKKAKRTPEEFQAFLELHIEQGSLLEREQKNIGIPGSIAGIKRFGVTVTGETGHAGTIPMRYRKDALVNAAKAIEMIYELALKSNDKIVATVGEIHVSPNSPSAVPGRADFVIEFRGTGKNEIDDFQMELLDWFKKRDEYAVVSLVEKAPSELSPKIQKRIELACERRQLSFLNMFSGANHDSSAMSKLTDAGMVFVPSKNGISHHPDEYSSKEDVCRGIQVLLDTVLDLMDEQG